MIVSLLEASQADQLTHARAAAEPVSRSKDAAGLASEQPSSKLHSGRHRLSSLAIYPSVRVVLLGGGELPGHLKLPLQALLPNAQISTAYGMTETCSSMTFGSLDMQHSPPASDYSCSPASTAAAAVMPTLDPGPSSSKAAEEQSASIQSARPGSAAGRHNRQLGASAIPVGWPPPGIEMAVAPLSADDKSSCSDISYSDTPVSPDLKVQIRAQLYASCQLLIQSSLHISCSVRQRLSFYSLTQMCIIPEHTSPMTPWHSCQTAKSLNCQPIIEQASVGVGVFMRRGQAMCQSLSVHCQVPCAISQNAWHGLCAGWRDFVEGATRYAGLLGGP